MRKLLTGDSEVHRARSRKTSELVALKKIIMHNEKDGVCTTKTWTREEMLMYMCSSP